MNHSDFALRTSREADATRRWCMNSPHPGYADSFGRLALALDDLARQEELLAARSIFDGWDRIRRGRARAYSG